MLGMGDGQHGAKVALPADDDTRRQTCDTRVEPRWVLY